MLYIHRWATLLAGLVILYIAVTGVWMQSMDLFSQVTHQPTTDYSIEEFRQHINGPDNYAVASDPDYTARILPAGLNANKALAVVTQAAHAAAPGKSMRLIELRMSGDSLVGRVKMGKDYMLFDAITGARLSDTLLPPANPNKITHGLRSEVKNWHKFAFTKFMLQKASTINLLAGIAVCVLTVTGFLQYLKLLKARTKVGKPQLFWSSGGWWRQLHRWTATVLGVVIVYLVVTGMLMAISDIGAAYGEWVHPRNLQPVNPDSGDFSTPLTDAEIPIMAGATLSTFNASHPGVPLKVLQLRYFAGYSQGVVVTGESRPNQHVYNTRDGREMSETEKGYPKSGNFPFGWEWHQTVKRLHRGDFFGIGGNWIEWLGGLGLIYFAASGLWMYFDMWRRRAKLGRGQILWR